jgi:hypothetical protein
MNIDHGGDVVVTLPAGKFKEWMGEGDAAGTPESGMYWAWHLGGHPPKHAKPGSRVYVMYRGQIIGYAPLVAVERLPDGGFNLIRGSGAKACTVPGLEAKGFRGYRYRWWDRTDERDLDLNALD